MDKTFLRHIKKGLKKKNEIFDEDVPSLTELAYLNARGIYYKIVHIGDISNNRFINKYCYYKIGIKKKCKSKGKEK